MASLKAKNLTFQYATGGDTILENVDFELEPGTFNLLIGSSGSGKSTLLKSLAGLYPTFSGVIPNGEVELDGELITNIQPNVRARKVAMLFQNPSRQFTMRTVEEQVSFALENLQVPVTDIEKRTEKAIIQVGIKSLAQEVIQNLSGGEQQKVALATVLAMDSKIILLDEPFANIDGRSKTAILKVLKMLQTEQNKTIVVADHDWSGYRELVDNVYMIKDRRPTRVSKSIFNDIPEQNDFKNPTGKPEYQLEWQNLQIEVPRKVLVNQNSQLLPKGKISLLSGENGVGKSSFLNVLAQQRKYQGLILFDNQNVKKIKQKNWATKLALVFQNSVDQFVEISVKDEFNVARQNSLHAEYWTEDAVVTAMKELNLEGIYSDGILYQISGGQQKKVQILSMLIMAQPIMLLDEPFAGLDYESVNSLMNLIRRVCEDLDVTFLIVSHQRNGVVNMIDYELVLINQEIKFKENTDEKNS